MSLKLLLERLRKWAKGEEAPPFRATLIITNRCDLDCLFCRGRFSSEGKIPRREELKKKEWIRVTTEGIRLGIKNWEITGGEPTLRNEVLLEIIYLIKKFDPQTTITLATSGSFLSSKIAKMLVRLGCDRIEIGIDGFNEKIHNFLRGKNYSFRKATNALKFLTSEKKRLKKEKPQIIVKTVVNKRNYKTLDKLALLAHRLGANIFRAVSMRIYEQNIPILEKTKLLLNKKDEKLLSQVWKKVEMIGKEYGIRVEKEFNCKEEKTEDFRNEKILAKKSMFSPFCYIPFYSLVIDGEGRVGPCSSIPPNALPNAPNVKKESLKKIWYGSSFNSLRKHLLEGVPISKDCKNCGLIRERNFIKSIM